MFRGKCGMLFHYDWISVPLVYTQVIHRPSLYPTSEALAHWSQGKPEGQLRPHHSNS